MSMTKNQAIQAILEGHIITHKLLYPTKFIFIRGCKVYNHKCEELNPHCSDVLLLISPKSRAVDGWELVHPEEAKPKKRYSKFVLVLISVVLSVALYLWIRFLTKHYGLPDWLAYTAFVHAGYDILTTIFKKSN